MGWVYVLWVPSKHTKGETVCMFRFIHKSIWAWHHCKQPLPNCKKLQWSLCGCDIGEMDVPAVFWQTLHFPDMVSKPAWYRCHQTFVVTADLLSCCCTLALSPRGIISQVWIWSCKSTCQVRTGAGDCTMRWCIQMPFRGYVPFFALPCLWIWVNRSTCLHTCKNWTAKGWEICWSQWKEKNTHLSPLQTKKNKWTVVTL